MDEHTDGPADEHGDRRSRAAASERLRPASTPLYAECVLCRKPTEYPETTRGITLCPVCEWQEAQRTACSG
ncbi:hypothetical protein [Streptomyces sp. NPDC056061]|uniref:hypothetical protein n=1 Tax=Streptomyces sp. NPDC056061 TaxID=3345700 RepID=UPI0035D72A7B